MDGRTRDMPARREYRCPGENYPITRSVHLARLAAFYSKCRDCPEREPAGGCSSDPEEAPRLSPERSGLFRANGIRGKYLNDIDRRVAGELAGAFASLLWDEDPPLLTGESRPGPTVVVGFDERPSSPDIVTGVALSLRRMGCQVVDIGLCTRPCFWFAVHHLHASAGVLVSGSDCDPSYTGLDFIGRGGIPASRPGLLNLLEKRWTEGYSRTSRSPGGQRSFQAWVPYEAGLWKHFHALRPLKVVVGCPVAAFRELLSRLFHPLACRLTLADLPVRNGCLSDSRDANVLRVGERVRAEHADVGFVVADDVQQTMILNEKGELIPPATWLDVLSEFIRVDQPESAIVSDQATFAAMVTEMHRHRAFLGGDHEGYVWFDDPLPTVDAVMTIAKSLQALSRSDAPVSQRAEGIPVKRLRT